MLVGKVFGFNLTRDSWDQAVPLNALSDESEGVPQPEERGVHSVKRRQSIPVQLLSSATHTAIKLSDLGRRFAALILVTGIVLVGASLWLTVSANASHWVWKSWERMFGPSAMANGSRGTHVHPEISGTSGYTITAIDEPSAGASAADGTIVFAINASGAMTGAYSDQAGVAHGFVYANGSFTSFDALNESGLSPKSGWFQGTTGIAINKAGDIAGAYIDGNNAYHGFVREESTGAITTFDDPNAPTANSSRGTFPLSINSASQVVGTYATGSYDTTSLYHGFLYSIVNGVFTEINEPNAGSGSASYGKEGTTPVSINDAGGVTGFYVDSSGNRHGFIYSAGNYTSFDAPGAVTNTGHGGSFSGTIPMSIDAAGDVTGSYTDSNSVRHGFIRTVSGTITPFDAPGANTTSQSGTIGGTLPMSFDPTGSFVAGMYADSSGLGHDFVYYLPLTASGSFTTFTAPNMTTSTALPIQGAVFSVNASGIVVGFYLDNNEVSHGFQYTPGATPAPTFSPAQGTYASEQSVTVTDSDSAATIFYTTDGSTPTVSSTKYAGPINVSTTETIKAIAFDSANGGYIESAVASSTYTIAGGSSGFSLSASPASVSVAQGDSGTSTITVTDVGGFSGVVTLAASDLPTGVTASFVAGSAAGTQVLTLAASTSAAVTSSPVTLTIIGSSGALTETTTVALSITAQPSFTGGPGGTTSISIAPGSTTGNTGTISVVGTNGFSGIVNLTCKVATTMTGVNDMPSCSLNPTSVTLNGTTAQTSTLTVTTTAATSAENRIQRLFAPMTGGTALALIALFLVPRRRQNWITMLAFVALFASLGAIGCGGGGSKGTGAGNSGTTPGTYTITVTGASGGINATIATVTLTVQ